MSNPAVAAERDSAADELAGVVRSVLGGCVARRDGSERDTTLGAGRLEIEAGRRYLAATAAHGLAVPGWPHEHGGRSASPDEVETIAAVHREYVIPDLYPFRVGTMLVGPTLLEHGSLAQRLRWLRRIAAGDDVWCQMFSEPDAGSDLANVCTIAVLDGDRWRLDGQKVWTSRGGYADWGICLARTDPNAPKHSGLTMFAIAMASDGVEVRPLVQMNGDSHFSEVFLSGVVVADSDRIGDVNGGWNVAVSLLAHERAGADRSAPRSGPAGWPTWLTDLVEQGGAGDAVHRDQAMRLYCLDEVIRLTQLRAATNRGAGHQPGPEGSGLKLHGTRSFKSRVELAASVAGAAAMLSDWVGAVDLLTAPSMSIRGGTDEIQRNILGERSLGLPADVRSDRNVPWTISRRGTKN